MKPNEKEELQSRRQFFKKAAQKVFPIIGAIVMSAPIIKAVPMASNSCTTGSCYGACYHGCSGTCYSSCLGGVLYVMSNYL